MGFFISTLIGGLLLVAITWYLGGLMVFCVSALFANAHTPEGVRPFERTRTYLMASRITAILLYGIVCYFELFIDAVFPNAPRWVEFFVIVGFLMTITDWMQREIHRYSYWRWPVEETTSKER